MEKTIPAGLLAHGPSFKQAHSSKHPTTTMPPCQAQGRGSTWRPFRRIRASKAPANLSRLATNVGQGRGGGSCYRLPPAAH